MKKVARSWYDFLPFPMIMTFILVSIGQTLAALGMMVIRLKWGVDFNSGDAMITASMYASFIGVWVVFLLAIILPGDNRPILKTIGPGMRGNTIGMLLLVPSVIGIVKTPSSRKSASVMIVSSGGTYSGSM